MRTFQTVTIISCLILSVGCGQKNENESAAAEQSKPISDKEAKNNTPQKLTASPNRPPGSTPAPDFTLATTAGELVSMSDLRGKVILLNFWGTWCGPCRMELPDFVKLHNKYNKDGLEIVGITIRRGESIEDVAKFQEQWGLNYLLLNDINGNEVSEVTMAYSQAIGQMINGIPTTLIIDREGFIVNGFVGPRREQVFFNAIKPYL
jgi:cytochrome c biogenesis protein CcmG/thiol:disulfide interchange protein DsbE